MKKSILLLLLALYTSFTAFAQKTATWKGGASGQKNAWNCPANWKEGRVPNEFSAVIIPDVSTSTFSYPLIESGIVEIYSLYCAPSAQLQVMPNARIIVQDASLSIPTVANGGLVYTGASLEESFSSVSLSRH